MAKEVSDVIGRFGATHAHCRQETGLAAYVSLSGLCTEELIFQGSETAVQLPVRTLVSRALQNEACAIILVHTHPSGNPKPSKKDIDQTHALERLLFQLSVRIEDHIILAGSERFSFRTEGLL